MKTTVNDINIAYDDHGIGLPVLFLHAFPLNRNMWEGELTALLLEERYRLVALDWPGFGESEIAADISTMDVFADYLAGLMDTLGMQSAVLCGLSMGGYAAFAFLRKYPRRVAGLILADTRPGADTLEAQANRENVARVAETQGTGAIADMQMPRLLSDYTRQHHPEVELRVRQLINAATPRGIAAASRGMAQRADSTDLLPGIACPTLVVVGEQDALTPPDVARDYAAKIPNALFITIPNAGHLSNLEQPEAFLQAIGGFLRGTF
ncbi:MAG TPA: alpha/beta fold hydrolase [Ktedonobacteraceae bacterium]|jgi:3-oxoadipate enol-lactonase|nr:alpha/beta fold hydrolase [Ktedonobacteraceae bacterium]